ncbi:hypothetical protein [Arcobacter sp. FWKO B]|uniref:hypothetical protein n=1 Tax=Arcobacter sp. FWKO B TaxID=2593672 RepID=UPI0018A47A56|nr:hypothetical protein [Arcobacter sp. FWKO B]QOG11234.1 hypothetical protein FWKOB_00370 [Arcobacter sp. FWKO B]
MSFEQYKIKIDASFDNIKSEFDGIEYSFTQLFDIQSVFSSDDRGKIKLSKTTFNTTHTDIQNKILMINKELQRCLDIVQNYFEKTLQNNKINKSVNIIDGTTENKKVLSMLIQEKNGKSISKELNNILILKDKIVNLQFLISLFDTSFSYAQISKMTLEELINSVFIFEFIDTCSILYKNFNEFKFYIENFYSDFRTNDYIEDIEILLELHKRNLELYSYQDIKYKIILEYNINIGDVKLKLLNKYFLQQAISLLIEQSCLDLIKKELKKGKFHKLIEINILKVKKNIRIIIKNNGFDTKELIGNEYINLILCDNIANNIDIILEADTIENEGMNYILKL